jgi:tyrosine-protein kinase Etk/Wzc
VQTANKKTVATVAPLVNKQGEEDPFFLEQIRMMRANFEYRVDTLKGKVFAITSSIPGEGKTFCAIHIAVNLASTGKKKVLLIDGDLRKSDLSRNMGIHKSPGLSEFLTGAVNIKDIVYNSQVPGLYVIPTGLVPPEYSTKLLAGEEFSSFMKKLRGKTQKPDHTDEIFDQFIVVIDTPPVLVLADTVTLREQLDGFMFVFRADYTPHSMLTKAVEEIGEGKIIGVVINGVEPKRNRYYKYYGKYYGNYYRK